MMSFHISHPSNCCSYWYMSYQDYISMYFVLQNCHTPSHFISRSQWQPYYIHVVLNKFIFTHLRCDLPYIRALRVLKYIDICVSWCLRHFSGLNLKMLSSKLRPCFCDIYVYMYKSVWYQPTIYGIMGQLSVQTWWICSGRHQHCPSLKNLRQIHLGVYR